MSKDINSMFPGVYVSGPKSGKDIKLFVGEYKLDTDCRAYVRNGKVIVCKKKPSDDTPRCRDCKHCVMGRSKYNQRYEHPVCKLQPKKNKGYSNHAITRQQRFYAVRESDAKCSKYEPKELAIGEIGVIDGVRVQCMKRNGYEAVCNKCAFCLPYEEALQCDKHCSNWQRKDNNDVYFKKIEQ